MNAWKAIASAPKDGTRILIAWEKDGVWEQRAAWWNPEFYFDMKPGGKIIHRGAWTDGYVSSFGYEETCSYSSFGYEETCSYEPTHWQPLPEPASANT